MSTTATYYIKTAADDVRSAMSTLQKHVLEAPAELQDTIGHQRRKSPAEPSVVQ